MVTLELWSIGEAAPVKTRIEGNYEFQWSGFVGTHTASKNRAILSQTVEKRINQYKVAKTCSALALRNLEDAEWINPNVQCSSFVRVSDDIADKIEEHESNIVAVLGRDRNPSRVNDSKRNDGKPKIAFCLVISSTRSERDVDEIDEMTNWKGFRAVAADIYFELHVSTSNRVAKGTSQRPDKERFTETRILKANIKALQERGSTKSETLDFVGAMHGTNDSALEPEDVEAIVEELFGD